MIFDGSLGYFFSAVKWLGAAYPVWLGIQALRSQGSRLSVQGSGSARGPAKIFKQGVLVAVLHPKVAIFFLAFLPQFVKPPLILVSGKLTGYLSKNRKISRWMERGLGTLFIGLGCKLAATD